MNKRCIQLGVTALLTSLLIVGCADDTETTKQTLDVILEETLATSSNGTGQGYYQLPASNDYAAIPQDPKNPITKEKVDLGKLLFHETAIAFHAKKSQGVGTFSCASCHHAAGGFQANLPQGIADGGTGFGTAGLHRTLDTEYALIDIDVQPVRTPSALNIAYQPNVLWNGQFGATGVNEGTAYAWTPNTPIATNNLGFEGTETQAIAGLAVHRLEIEDDTCITKEGASDYPNLFAAAFPSSTDEERISTVNAGLAIAAYERTLLANESPFQQWLGGNELAMTDEEKEGAILFFGKANCASCHNGPALNTMEFHALGMKDLSDAEDAFFALPENDAHKGRWSFTKRSQDMYKFKVPQLYNLKDSPFYGHGASFRSIRDVVEYKNKAVAENSKVPNFQLAEEFVPLNLTETEVDQIVAFLENGLYDPNLTRYVPETLPSGNCFPVNDAQGKLDLGCD